ncbi:MAG TPA: hypothetical protein VII11_05740 [Bacteroidota bacterium]
MNTHRTRLLTAIALTSLAGWVVTLLATTVFMGYAFGLFVWLPMAMGAVSTLLIGRHNPADKTSQRIGAFGTLVVYCVGLIIYAFEGAMCIIMASPAGIIFTWIGYAIGANIIKIKTTVSPPTALGILLLGVPSMMGIEHATEGATARRAVVTSVEIHAAPETVWQNVVAFPQLEEPTELLFKAGIAYPISAQIDGNGVGAIRHCNFSTGSFIEPITVWDEPRLLRFDVLNQPEPMKELSPYDIRPNHLHGYFVSKQGQFRLVKLPNGNTLLEGTTWYENRIKPDFYWNLWSDEIIHRIHRRVLEHIKQQAESTSPL